MVRIEFNLVATTSAGMPSMIGSRAPSWTSVESAYFSLSTFSHSIRFAGFVEFTLEQVVLGGPWGRCRCSVATTGSCVLRLMGSLVHILMLAMLVSFILSRNKSVLEVDWPLK